MDLIFLPEADADIDRLFDFLFKENPPAAEKAMLLIDEGASKLERFPELGVSMDDDTGRRELFIPFGKSVYVLRYRLYHEQNKIVILRVWHGREQRPEKK
jgi:plasmid stabilization system protein ParE